MSATGEAKLSRGRLRARGEAKAGTERPSARPEPEARSLRQARPAKEGDPKGAAPHDSMRPTRRCLDLRMRCEEAGR